MNRYKNMTISDIKSLLSDANFEQYPNMLNELAEDERAGVQKIVLQYSAKYQKHLLELKRIENLKRIEETLYEEGYRFIAGTDEVGRGPLCGPVVSAAVIMPRESSIAYINDSKQVSEKKREELYERIMSEAISVGIGIVEHDVIDEINILNATKLSMRKALDDLSIKPDLLLLDALRIDADIQQRSYIKGDATVYTIAAASIIAKVTRDRMMIQYHELYPQYRFDSNKGYGSAEHIEAIRTHGACPIHRRSFITNHLQNNTKKTGDRFEDIACRYLQQKGYVLVQRRYRRAGGEIDIICRDGEDYVFCEVKARSSRNYGAPEEFVDAAKQQKLIQTAQNYMAEKAIFKVGRFDVIAIDIADDNNHQIKHIINAFSL